MYKTHVFWIEYFLVGPTSIKVDPHSITWENLSEPVS